MGKESRLVTKLPPKDREGGRWDWEAGNGIQKKNFWYIRYLLANVS